MLPALYDDDRRAFARLATMLIAGALCVLPLTAQTSLIAGAASVHDVPADSHFVAPTRLTFPAYEIVRDPFVAEASARASVEHHVAPMRVEQGQDIGVALPPNVGARQNNVPSPPETFAGAVVRAIVLGDPPRALVEVGGLVRVLGRGDRIGALTVVGIGAGRVTLSDGSALVLDGNRK